MHHLTAQLRTLSMSDKLTGLGSRELLVERLERRRRSRDTGGHAVVLFIDLDRFKAVNDTFGHQVGDDVLILASKRLQRLTSARDTVARLGGDEFVIFIDHVRRPEDATCPGSTRRRQPRRAVPRLGVRGVHRRQRRRHHPRPHRSGHRPPPRGHRDVPRQGLRPLRLDAVHPRAQPDTSPDRAGERPAPPGSDTVTHLVPRS
jgi:GGDEF domain-containing protein